MILTNQEIYAYASNLIEAFKNKEQILPARINFYIQKNMKNLITLAQEIDDSRTAIISKYGKLIDDGTSYQILPEQVHIAQGELDDLFAIQQDVAVLQIPLANLDNEIMLTMEQMEALLFMIKEE